MIKESRAENRHEPRSARSDDDSLGVVGVEDPQCPEVFGTAVEGPLERVVVTLHLGHLAAPTRQPLGRGGALDRLATPVPRRHSGSLEHGMDLEAGRPFAVRRDDRLEGDDVVADGAGLGRAVDLDPPVHGPPLVGKRKDPVARLCSHLAVRVNPALL